MDNPERHEWPELSGETREVWDQIAGFWDERFGEGNAFHRTLVAPPVERLLALKPGERILDVACGNGAFARRMAGLGAQVTACDFSRVFLERAREISEAAGLPITYAWADAADQEQLLAFGERGFDAVVCNMAIMDMPAIEPLVNASVRLLAPGGRMVFSVLHPCFNSIYTSKVIEEEDRDGKLIIEYSVKQSGYLRPEAHRGLGMIGQPAPQIYFHRPLSVILQAAFQAGFVMDGCEEPAFPPGTETARPTSWEAFSEFPPVFAARLRPR